MRDFVLTAVAFRDAVHYSFGGDYEALDSLRPGIFSKTKAVLDAKQRLAGAEDEVIYGAADSRSCRVEIARLQRRIQNSGDYPRTLYYGEPCRWKVLRREQRKKAASRPTPVKRGRPRK